MKNRTFNLGLLFIFIIPTIAVFLWIIAPNTARYTFSLIDILTITGKLFGIIGTMLFAIALILSARFHFLENLFYGLNKVYERHSQIGQIAFIFLLFHPAMLLGIYSNLTFRSAIQFFTPSVNWAQNWGIFSLIHSNFAWNLLKKYYVGDLIKN